MPYSLLFLSIMAAPGDKAFTVPKGPTEWGSGITQKEALKGWISLFDGKTTYGWRGSRCTTGALKGGETTARFSHYEIRAEILEGGSLLLGRKTVRVKPGLFRETVKGNEPLSIRLNQVKVKSIAIRPLGLQSVFNGKDLSGWKVIQHPRLPSSRQTKWSVKKGAIVAVGGPGALELPQKYGNVILQVDVKTGPLTNGGVFFRCQPGLFMQGYEAQIFNACYHNDRSKPARYSTGAIDDRQLARRLVSSDQEVFRMTVVATGASISTWVNGYQTTDWLDAREPHDNPRRGRRIKPGTIQLQAHDPETRVEFSKILVGAP